MSSHTVFEHNGYFYWAFAAELPGDKWEAFVFFERKADHNASAVTSVKHRIKAEFKSRDEAMSAASQLGYDLADKDLTKLDELGGDFVNNG